MSYGASAVDQYRQSGLLVGRILGGAEPAELPVMYLRLPTSLPV
jgi:hypothetical protein